MIRLENVSKIYKSNSILTNALNNINLSIEDNEFIAIVGTSGCGKTTLLNIIGCMDTLSNGNYYYDNICVNKLNTKEQHNFRKNNISFVFQHFELMNNYTIYENVEMPLLARNISKNNRKEKVNYYLNKVGILEQSDRLPCQISGGQKQRCAIARAIACETNLIIADEPTGALDSKTSLEIMKLFCELNKSGKTIIIVTHDMDIANKCKRVVKISDGKIIT